MMPRNRPTNITVRDTATWAVSKADAVSLKKKSNQLQ